MADQDKTKSQLIEELQTLRAKVAAMEQSAPAQSVKSTTRQIANALQESEARYRTLFDGVPVGLFCTTPEGQFIDANPALVEMLGYPDQATLLATNVNKLYIDPTQRQTWQTAIAQDGVAKTYLGQLCRYDGTPLWVESHARIIQDGNGQIYYEGVLKDIDERKRAEEALQASEAKYRLLVENQTDLVVEFDTEYRLLFVSPSYCEAFGKTEDELLGNEFMPLIHEDDREQVAESLMKVFQPPYTSYHEERALTVNGWRWLAWSNRAVLNQDGRVNSIVAIGRDITERIQIEETAQQTRQQLQDMFDHTPAAVYMKDMTGRFIFVNRVVHERMGFPASEILGKTLGEIYPELKDGPGEYWEPNEKQVLETGAATIFEEFGRTTGRAYLATKFLLYDQAGTPYALCNSSLDITQHKRAEEAVQRSAQQFQDMFDHTLAVVYVRDLDGRFIFVNREWTQRTGVCAEEAVGKTPYALFPGYGYNQWDPHEKRVLETGEAKIAEEIGHTTNRVYLATKFLLRDTDGTPYALCNSSIDITERKQAEETAQRAKQQFQDMFDNTPAAVYVRDLDGRYIFVNREWCERTGFSPGKAVGKTDRELFPHFMHDQWDSDEQQVLDSGQTVQCEQVGRTTGRVYLATKFLLREADGTPYALCNSSVDITERVQAEKVLQHYATRLEMLRKIDQGILVAETPEAIAQVALAQLRHLLPCQHATVGVFDHDTDERILFAIDTQVASTLKTGDRHALDAHWMDAFQQGKPYIIGDIRDYPLPPPALQTMRDNGFLSLIAVPLRIQNELLGSLNLMSKEAHTFTDECVEIASEVANQLAIALRQAHLYEQVLRHTEELEQRVVERTTELQQAKERVEVILSNSPDAVLFLNSDGIIGQANAAVSELFGYRTDEIFRQSLTLLVEADHIDFINDALQVAVNRGSSGRLEFIAQRKDKSTFDADAAISSVKEGDKVIGLVCSIRDISAFKEVERMKDEFVSNVSHELRTPITNLKLRQHLISAQPDKFKKHLEVLRRETDRLDHIVNDLLRLSRMDQRRLELKFESVDLNELSHQYVTDRTPLAESLGLQLTLIEGSGVPPVRADEGLLGQVLSILLTNSLNYTPSGGTVSVSIRTRQFEDRHWAGFSVNDTGPGIAKEEQSQLFTRFFRGKAGLETGISGTGLGLAIAHKIVDQHQGQIEVESEGIPDKGTMFTVWLLAELPESTIP